ncbi:ABC transporter ATP-binding protein [Desulfuribacillus alkaliarsenatis]|uniref:ABC-type quaternary amine transporter n=1 Tax=Desulfuribacillus alkaliarsenatis TaxID=766136 RepID=A0A1E5G0K6_9FIRM|nr:ABC transporter ATP-binding protein [Desulfuribacillus alkaliarsenatis]OEF96239.1 ABC transporter ATP-binding protein [Desulfuribacillus alkaliarsenatis]
MFDIELKSVTKTYIGSDNPALTNLCLSVEKGSIITLLGPSGCGKSTTLRLIAGFERADSGVISIAGKVVSSDNAWIPPEKRGVGMVFQDYALFPHLDVYNNIGFNYKQSDRDKRIKEVIELVNLNGFEKRFPHELSGGQQQRVALARALARRPVVVLLDEPFSNLDADLRTHMRVEVKRIIKEAGATAVFVSHDQKDALAISDRIIVMKDGVIQQNGTPREIYQFPANTFVAKFVGQTNMLEGIIGPDAKSVVTELGTIPCNHTHSLPPGEKVYISVRPDSLEMDANGDIEGVITQATYTGESIDALAQVKLQNNKTKDMLVHIHPEVCIRIGDKVNFKVLPNFVAVVKHENY